MCPNKRFAGGLEPAASISTTVLRIRGCGSVSGVAPHEGRVRAPESGRSVPCDIIMVIGMKCNIGRKKLE